MTKSVDTSGGCDNLLSLGDPRADMPGVVQGADQSPARVHDGGGPLGLSFRYAVCPREF